MRRPAWLQSHIEQQQCPNFSGLALTFVQLVLTQFTAKSAPQPSSLHSNRQSCQQKGKQDDWKEAKAREPLKNKSQCNCSQSTRTKHIIPYSHHRYTLNSGYWWTGTPTRTHLCEFVTASNLVNWKILLVFIWENSVVSSEKRTTASRGIHVTSKSWNAHLFLSKPS